MPKQEVLNKSLNGGENHYDEALHSRFLLHRDQSGASVAVIASKTNRSTAAISQYINRKYPGNVAELEEDIRVYLRRAQDLEFMAAAQTFVTTDASILIYEVLQYCDRHCKMGAVVGPSGAGKTQTLIEYKNRNRASILVTLDPTKRSLANVIRRVASQTGGVGRRHSTADLLDAVMDRLRGSRRLLMIDEAHFMSWEALEVARKIHDCCRIGVVYAGQERLYDQMVGNDDNARLFDQIFSRIAVKRDRFPVKKKDTAAIAATLCEGLDQNCIDYLYQIAREQGRYRNVQHTLEAALSIRSQSGRPMDIDLVREADRFRMKR